MSASTVYSCTYTCVHVRCKHISKWPHVCTLFVDVSLQTQGPPLSLWNECSKTPYWTLRRARGGEGMTSDGRSPARCDARDPARATHGAMCTGGRMRWRTKVGAMGSRNGAQTTNRIATEPWKRKARGRAGSERGVRRRPKPGTQCRRPAQPPTNVTPM